MRVCQNPLFNKTTPATDLCGRGGFHIFGVLAHPHLMFYYQTKERLKGRVFGFCLRE
ncbi:MAG: hypothetical protein RR333_05395 [Bacteroidales bacterium]